jgi:hypothetical protein
MTVVYNFLHTKSICEMSCNVLLFIYLFIERLLEKRKCMCSGDRMVSWNYAGTDILIYQT